MTAEPGGDFVRLDGEVYYRISGFDRLAPFMMSIPSDSDLWMFITSGGGLTAGRIDADGALFPYQTVDRLHDAHHHTGPLTLLRVERPAEAPVLWEPFTIDSSGLAHVERNLYKNVVGNRIVFEEKRHDLGLAFRYSWGACDEYGWVRTARLENIGGVPAQTTLLDGLRNLLPYGAPLGLYQQASNLVDAYKKSEIDRETGLGIFSLTSGITDRAEAIEMLRANTVWCSGLPEFRVHLSPNAIDAFRQGRLVPAEDILNGARGNYLITSRLDLAPGDANRWHLVGDTGLDQGRVAEIRHQVRHDAELSSRLESHLAAATDNLRRNVASADGLQLSEKTIRSAHHFANVLFNNMRGGVFARNYDCPVDDFRDFLTARNKLVSARHESLLAALPATVSSQALREKARATGDPDFTRLCYEYLPLHFGRRHGDPSRPWNHFSIRMRNEAGEKTLSYQGNWRDVFQNWEALATAFPGFLPNIVAKFVNASTVDGYNPYRINQDGFEWETIDPENPWSNIGYWGDHQIIYLLKLLEAWQRHDPADLAATLGADVFSYADIPYRLKPYPEMTQDPSATINFDDAGAAEITDRVAELGTDGKLVVGADGNIQHANLVEKLLVPALSKLSNLVPDGGIWMNTQRPEWNDANNALAGGGLSVVTMCHLRRYLDFLAGILAQQDEREFPVATEIADWFERVAIALDRASELMAAGQLSATERKEVLDGLGRAFSAYRETVYARGFVARTSLPARRIAAFCAAASALIDQGIAANKREDGLYHTYNMLDVCGAENTAEVIRLQEMLEGQVAVLSAGLLSPREACSVLHSLFASRMYKADQRSFVLYPVIELPGFMQKNVIPEPDLASIVVLREMMAANDTTLIARDADGICRFDSEICNAEELATALDAIAARERWAAAMKRDRASIVALFEEVFNHQRYTGRSGNMYGYEGLGCIYWHMVAKLLLVVQENLLRAEREGESGDVCRELARYYYKVRAGIGYEKTVTEYGAFPADPYSHTPGSGGAKQPGMTGQVKEEILTRRAELGVRVRQGKVNFAPVLLQMDEFLRKPLEFGFVDPGGREQTLAVAENSLAFTVCQVPVLYQLTDGAPSLEVTDSAGEVVRIAGSELPAQWSGELFNRTGAIRLIRVGVPRSTLGKISAVA